MAAPKTRNGSERAARLDVVSRMYLQRFRLVDIAAECGVTFQQISYDLKKVRKQWIESAVRDFDAARSQELAKLATRNAWAGVERTYKAIVATGHAPSFEDHYSGAHAARAHGPHRARGA